LADVADAIVDSIYVLLGMAVAFGIDIHPVWYAVHEANMATLGEDGKQMKPEGWTPPYIEGILQAQIDQRKPSELNALIEQKNAD
jgi:predicted HAD superfamily Cof-like phosphohydrolase